MKLDKYDILLIRACKTGYNFNFNVLRRLRRIWRLRCGLGKNFPQNEMDSYIVSHLMDLIVDHFPKEKVKKFMFRMIKQDSWDLENGYGCDSSIHYHKILIYIISEIRLTRTDVFDGFISPKRFRVDNA